MHIECSNVQSALLGSVSRNVLRFGDKHLLIMRFKRVGGAKGLEFAGAKGTRGVREGTEPEKLAKYCEDIFSKVLVPTDFSQPEEAAISFIKSIDGIKEVSLLHVVHKGETQQEIDTAVKDATDKLRGLSQELINGGLKATSKVVIGSTVEEIRKVADVDDVSLIAMSSVGKDTLKTGRIGSRTYDVANAANRPVLVVRMKSIFSFSAA